VRDTVNLEGALTRLDRFNIEIPSWGFANTGTRFGKFLQTGAATITVTNTNDSGPGSLRQAFAIANDGDTITFAVTGTITLTSGGLLIAKNVTIAGPGADQLSIDGNQALFVFGVFPEKTAAISGLTIRNGQAGIWNEQATLTASDCVVSHNSYDGLYSHAGTLIVRSCVVSDNSGGGLYNDSGVLTVSNCMVTTNSYGGVGNNGFHFPPGNNRSLGSAFLTIDSSIISDNSGTGISNTGGSVMIVDNTLSGNSTGQGNSGGGISNGKLKTPADTVTIINSTINSNSADEGGGIFNANGLVSIVNSTVSGNSATYDGGGIANAGGVVIANSTASGNSAGYDGGGISNVGFLEISNTILNAGTSGENIFNNGGTVTTHGYNVCSDNGGGLLNGPGDQINTDPLLGALQDNGGPTFTHTLLPGSPAIDAGDPNFTPPPFRDQRGPCFHRVFSRRIDVGSVETQPQPRCVTPAPRPTPH